MGHVKLQQQDLDEALFYLTEARQAREASHTLESVEGAHLWLSLGHIKREQEDFAAALMNYYPLHAPGSSITWLPRKIGTCFRRKMGTLFPNSLDSTRLGKTP